MKRHSDLETRIPTMRYHTQTADQLYVPIPFLFVTDRMCQEINAERDLILSLTPSPIQVRQQKLLGRYNPDLSASAFHGLLRLFAVERKDSTQL